MAAMPLDDITQGAPGVARSGNAAETGRADEALGIGCHVRPHLFERQSGRRITGGAAVGLIAVPEPIQGSGLEQGGIAGGGMDDKGSVALLVEAATLISMGVGEHHVFSN